MLKKEKNKIPGPFVYSDPHQTLPGSILGQDPSSILVQ